MNKTAPQKRAPARRTATTAHRSVSRQTRGGATTIRNFKQAMAFINARTNYETMLRVGYNHTNFNLSRMLRLLAAIDNPHRKLKTIHVAGTKGKGSTATMIAGMLQNSGMSVGLYTSPHVIDIRERIAIDGENVSEPGFARLISALAPAVNRMRNDAPTFFEIMTAAAFKHFVDQEVDLAVIETGLGGRLDSTNVIRPEVAAITNISFDHMAQLGNTLEAIAEEKAGIFKPGVPIISAPQEPGPKRVLRAAAEKIGAPIRFVGDDLEYTYRFESSRLTGPHARVCMATSTSRFDHVQVPLLGEHQAQNCAVALGVIDALRQRGYPIAEQTAIDGLARVRIPGRLEKIRDLPHTIVDAAHNAASISALMRAIGQNISYDSMVVIFGCSADKDIDGMLDQLQIGADKVIFTSTGTPRSANPRELLLRFQERSQKMAQVEPTLRDAYRTATHCVTREDLICITGSFYLVGAAKLELAGNSPV